MYSIKTKDIIIVYFLILISVFLFAFWPHMFFFKELPTISVSPKDFSNGQSDLTYRLKQSAEDIVDTYNAKIPKNKIDEIDSDNLWIIVKKVDAQGYKLWWNDEFIGSLGDIENGRANIWNSSEVFRISSDNIVQENELKILMHSQYDIGINDRSIQIADEQTIKKIHSVHMFFSCYLTYISIGVALFSILLSAILMILYKYNRTNLVFLMCIMVSVIIYSFESLNIRHFDMSFLMFKKIVLISIYINVFLCGFFVKKIVKKNYPLYVGAFTLLVFVVGAMICGNMLEFKKFYNITIALIPVSLVVYVAAMIPKFKTDDSAKIFIGGFVIFCFVPLWEMYANFINSEMALSSTYPVVIGQAAMLVLVMMNENNLVNSRLANESAAKEHYFNMSVRDELTGFHNREYWCSIVGQKELPYTIVMMDIDDFKNLNDKYGHQYGDFVLENMADVMKETIREEDVIGRYGGDEFMIALICSRNEAESVIERLRDNIASMGLKNGSKSVAVSVSIGAYYATKPMSIKEMLDKADAAMYGAKKIGKNTIIAYTE